MKGLAVWLVALFLSSPVLAGEIILETDSGNLVGELEGDPSEQKVVVLIHPGSGPTDRDGNSAAIPGGKNNGLKYIADHLTKNGIASLRVDKRGIAASAAAGKKEKDLRFENYVEDCAAWVEELKARGFSRVVILGHSEGSLIGMIAAKSSGADGFISVAGPARPAREILEDQLRNNLPALMLGRSMEILDSLEAGEQVDDVPKMLNTIFRRSVQPYLISWFAYDPSEEIAKLDVPVLILHGTTDIQVPVEEAGLLEKQAKDGSIVIVEGMNHVLKRAKGNQFFQRKSYSDPDMPVCQELLDAVVEFVKELSVD